MLEVEITIPAAERKEEKALQEPFQRRIAAPEEPQPQQDDGPPKPQPRQETGGCFKIAVARRPGCPGRKSESLGDRRRATGVGSPFWCATVGYIWRWHQRPAWPTTRSHVCGGSAVAANRRLRRHGPAQIAGCAACSC
mmetsp:Transcript_35294/g.89913  ORF Transcript_35294/g.89913 Transcript_35294/m.89913 type:complete len:138 (-) Transcript_35294:385-798(-)